MKTRLDQEEIDDLLKSKFELYLISIEARTKSGYRNFTGKGILTQTNGHFILKMFCNEKYTIIDYLQYESSNGTQAGQLIERDKYYSLSAKDLSGRNWSIENILFYIPYTNNDGDCVLVAEPSKIQMISDTCSDIINSITFLFNGDIKFPGKTGSEEKITIGDETIRHTGIINCAKFGKNGYNFLIENRFPTLTFQVSSKKKEFHESNATRCEEGLQFVLCRQLHWFYKEIINKKKRTITLRNLTNSTTDKSNIFPPLKFNNEIDQYDCIWEKLFIKYFQYTKQYKKVQYHPLFIPFNNIIGGKEYTLNLQALVSVVMVERLLNTDFTNIDNENSFSADEINMLIKNLGNLKNINSKLITRTCTFLENINNPRAIDKLHALQSKKIIEKKLVTRWKTLRNKTVHGVEISGNRQTLLRDIDYTFTLLLQLIFYKIGYSGKYTDYSTLGYPTKDFTSS